MNIIIITVGKWKNSPEKTLFEHYIARIPTPWKVELKEIDVKDITNKDKQKAIEAEKIIAACKTFGSQTIIALDEKGKSLPSRELAKYIGEQFDSGLPKLAFVIGGHAGLDDSIRQKASRILSFGEMTWSHLLVRPMLAEQIYRSWSILNNHPYHRD